MTGTLGTTSAPTCCNSSIASRGERVFDGVAGFFAGAAAGAAFFDEIAFAGAFADVLAGAFAGGAGGAACLLPGLLVLFLLEVAPSPAPVLVSFFLLIAIQLPYSEFTSAESNPQASHGYARDAPNLRSAYAAIEPFLRMMQMRRSRLPTPRSATRVV
ncbi:MAG TPA: hypothetical protein VE010_23395 [Thermoanaerobaculia bacterium]|nr:hypothetical protein [Thermoanaerobaculia bacterium]